MLNMMHVNACMHGAELKSPAATAHRVVQHTHLARMPPQCHGNLSHTRRPQMVAVDCTQANQARHATGQPNRPTAATAVQRQAGSRKANIVAVAAMRVQAARTWQVQHAAKQFGAHSVVRQACTLAFRRREPPCNVLWTRSCVRRTASTCHTSNLHHCALCRHCACVRQDVANAPAAGHYLA
mgnify:CR=1 FL=1